MWPAYLKERTGKEVLNHLNGFAIYSFPEPGICYLEDIYVVPEYRRSKVGSAIANQVEVIAKERNCEMLWGSVDVKAKGATESLKAVLSFDMKVFAIEGNMILFTKSLKGE